MTETGRWLPVASNPLVIRNLNVTNDAGVFWLLAGTMLLAESNCDADGVASPSALYRMVLDWSVFR